MAPPVGLEHLPGTRLPAGTFTIDAAEDRQLVQVLGGNHDGDGVAHPVWAYIAAQRGIGISVAELCALADFDVADGPLLGSCAMTWSQPLRIGTPYDVVGEVLGIERKQGRSGTFDVFTYRERLIDPEGDEASSVTNVFVLPRKES